MTHLDLPQLRYLARVTADEVNDAQPQAPLLALYAPGLPCVYHSAHPYETAATLHAGFLVERPSEWGFAGRNCYEQRYRVSLAPWQTALRNRHLLVGTRLPPTWRETTRKDYWKLVPALALLWQVEPDKGFLLGYLQRLTTNKQALTEKQEETARAMLRERGARGYSRSKELQAHTRVLLARRDHIFELGRLARLPLAPADQETVQDFLARLTGKQGRYPRSLTEGQGRLLRALEAQYLKERLSAAKRLAERLAREMKR